MSHLFDVSLAKLEQAKAEVRRQLIEAQLVEWPDSLILTTHEMLKRRLDFSQVPFMQSYEQWVNDPYNTLLLDPEDNFAERREYDRYVERTRARHMEQVLRSIAIAHQHECVVFYECGRNDDGTYKWCGARYGIEPGDYMSGFGRTG